MKAIPVTPFDFYLVFEDAQGETGSTIVRTAVAADLEAAYDAAADMEGTAGEGSSIHISRCVATDIMARKGGGWHAVEYADTVYLVAATDKAGHISHIYGVSQWLGDAADFVRKNKPATGYANIGIYRAMQVSYRDWPADNATTTIHKKQ